MRLLRFAFLLVAAPLAAQVSGPPDSAPSPAPASTPAPLPRSQSTLATPLYGFTGGITIPIGRLADDHSAGYELGGLVEYAVAGQPYSLRGELIYQRFPLKSGRSGIGLKDANLVSFGTTVVYRMQKSTTQTFVVGGIGIYNATGDGTRPGFNGGTGVEIPLTGFAALAELRLHLMLADAKPVMAIPLTVGLRF
ncbi:MAG: hypothetical protein H0W68_11075 [Gemmatimonadaceae bacterium]|nr:hypothetical protein [Gemmatimonadaceae bacterium]